MEELTIEQIRSIQSGEVFATGVVKNQPGGVYMTDSRVGDDLMWVAVRGFSSADWCIYIHWAEKGLAYCMTNGDKVINKFNIQKLVPCTNEVFSHYRF